MGPPPTRRRPSLWRWLPRALGPLILIAILLQANLNETVTVLGRASWQPILVAYLLFVPSLFLRAWRWRILMTGPAAKPSYLDTLSAYAFSILMGNITPGRVGELSKVVYLKQRGSSVGSSLFSVLADRLLDILFLLGFGLGAVSSLVIAPAKSSMTVFLVTGGVASGLVLAWSITRGPLYEPFVGLLQRALPGRWRDRVVEEYRRFSQSVRGIGAGAVAAACLLSAGAWAANFSSVYLFGSALGFDISYFDMASIGAVCALVALIPISILGLGTRDAALIAMLGSYGIGQTGAIALSTLILSMLVANALICSVSLATPAANLEWRSQS